MLLQDLLSSAGVTVWNENNTKIQRMYKKIQRRYERNTGDNYSFNYSTDKMTPGNDEEEVNATTCPKKPNPGKKNVQISINRISNHTGVLSEKKPLEFFFYNRDEKPGHENLISVDVKD